MSRYFFYQTQLNNHDAFCVLNRRDQLVWLGFSNDVPLMIKEAAKDLKCSCELIAQGQEKDLTSYLSELEAKLLKNSLIANDFELSGTEFQMSVWNELLKIKAGDTVSYSEIAHKIGRPKAVRAVGTAVGSNPVSYFIPCHRVIGKSGKIKTGYRWGTNIKEDLLRKEGAF